MKIKISDIKISPAYNMDNSSDLKILRESIEKVGLINPILVKKMENNQYELLDGYSRVRVYKQLRQKEIEANVIECSDLSAIEYINMKPIMYMPVTEKEKGKYIIKLMEKTRMTIEELAKKINKTVEEVESWIKAAKE